MKTTKMKASLTRKMQSVARVSLAVFALWLVPLIHSHAAPDDFVDLRGKKSLSDSEAKDLAKRAGPTLFLNDVVEISDVAIETLAARDGGLILKGLSSISLRAAIALSKHVGPLNLDLVEPPDEIVALLARNRGELGLNAITALTPAAAKALASTHQGILGLNGVTKLSAEAAGALAGHRGMVGLAGITTLTPATASALAKAEYAIYLTDRKAFSQEVRAMLSQHHGRIFLTGMDLPQCFEVDHGWFAEGDDAQRIIATAIKDALGEDLPKKEADDLGGVVIHSNLRDYVIEANTPTQFLEDPRCLMVPAPSDDNDHPDNPTCVRVDSISGEIICVQKIFPDAPLGELAEAVVKRFGKSDRKLDERSFVKSFQTLKYTTAKYTFPNALVRVIGKLSQDFRGNEKVCTEVWICSRPWVEENLNAYGSSVFTSCAWARRAIDAWDGEQFAGAGIESLPGTTDHRERVGTSTLFIDSHRSKLLERLAQLRPNDDNDEARNIAARGEHFAMVGCFGVVTMAGRSEKIPVIIVSPLNSTVAGFRPIMSRDVFYGPCNIIGTRANDLLRDVANHIVQSHFEPSTDTITVVRSQNDALMAEWIADSRLTQIDKAFRCTSEMARFEWVDTNGWTVRVCFDEGTICFFKTPKQAGNPTADQPARHTKRAAEDASTTADAQAPSPTSSHAKSATVTVVPRGAAPPPAAAPAPASAGYPKYEALARQLFASSGFRNPEDKKASTIRNTIEMAGELGIPDDRLTAMLEQSLANARSQGLDDSFAVTSLESGARQALAMKRVRP